MTCWGLFHGWMFSHTSRHDFEQFASLDDAKMAFRERYRGRDSRFKGLMLSPVMEIFFDDPTYGKFDERRPDLVLHYENRAIVAKYKGDI